MGWGWIVLRAAAWGAELGAGETTSPSQEPLTPVITPCSIWEPGALLHPVTLEKGGAQGGRVPAAEQLWSPGTAHLGQEPCSSTFLW